MTRLITSLGSGPGRPGGAALARADPEEAPPGHPCVFDTPGTSNGPTEAINGLLEHLRGTANTCEAPPKGSATSSTTSPDAYSTREVPTPNPPPSVMSHLNRVDRPMWVRGS